MNTYYIALAALFFTMFAIFPLHAEKTSALVGWESATPLLADANIEAGQKVAHVCASCHTFDKGGVNKFGPNLYNIVNNNHAQMEGFTYSDVLKAMHDKKWTYEALDRFLFNSKTSIGVSLSRVRIPPCPPFLIVFSVLFFRRFGCRQFQKLAPANSALNFRKIVLTHFLHTFLQKTNSANR